jgi:hypothetical protein
MKEILAARSASGTRLAHLRFSACTTENEKQYKVKKKLGSVTKVLGTSERAQEIIGEFGTALVTKLIGFEPSTMKMDSRHGSNSFARHKSSGVWGVFESKGGSSQLGKGASYGDQMGAQWISHWIPKTYKMNLTHEDGKDLRTKYNTFQPTIAVITRVNLKLRRDQFKVGIQVYMPLNGLGMNKWKGF